MPLPRIVSDGTPNGTHVYDGDGNEIIGISMAAFYIEAGCSFGKLTIQFPLATADVSGELSEESQDAYNALKALK